MRSRLIIASALVLSLHMLVFAGGQLGSAIKRSELDRMPFIAGKLKMTITKFKDNVVISSELRNTGVGYIEVNVENLAPEFTTFFPNRLLFLDRNNDQASILGVRHVNEIYAVQDTRLAPQARIKGRYNLTDKLEPPVRVYYDDRLLGTILD